MNGYATWLADVLRGAGLQVVEYDGWKTRGHGGFTGLDFVTWHHDASAIGDSPGVPRYMLSNWNRAGAQLWVSRGGVWHVIAAGVAYHAGAVLPGKPSNRNSLGVETDHTTGESWPTALLDSLRIGTKAIFDHLGTNSSHLEFHKTVCSPRGRKVDPDGLDLATERIRVAQAGSRKTLPLGYRTLGRGDEGEDVVELQGLLSTLYPSIGRDGDFGPETEMFVRAFQVRAGLLNDGLVGAATLAALRAAQPRPVVLPAPPVPVVPIPLEVPYMFIFADPRGGIFLREAGKTTHLSSPADVSALMAAGVKNAGTLSESQCRNFGSAEVLAALTA